MESSTVVYQVGSIHKDCGAGVGRITKALFAQIFKRSDLLEPAKNLIDQAKIDLEGVPGIGDYYRSGMQEFTFDKKYDMIWIQWVIGHLTDKDLLTFLAKCKEKLTPTVRSV